MQTNELEKLATQLLPKQPPASLRNVIISATTKALSASELSGWLCGALAKWAVGVAVVLIALNIVTEISLCAFITERLPEPVAQSSADDLQQLMVELRGGSAGAEPLLAMARFRREPLLSVLKKRKEQITLMSGHATLTRSDRRSWR